MMRVLFVCLGNICRSPSAEGIFRDLVRKEGLSDLIETDSCGTGSWHIGNPPDPRAISEAASRGVSLNDLRGRQLRPSDFTDFDYVLAMDKSNLANLRRASPPDATAHVALFMSYTVGEATLEVPDPYYGGADGFRDVFDQLKRGADGLLGHLRHTHGDLIT